MKKKKAASIAVIVFFAVLTAIGFAANDYGVPVDEHWEMQTLKENLHEYAVHFGADEWSASPSAHPQARRSRWPQSRWPSAPQKTR